VNRLSHSPSNLVTFFITKAIVTKNLKADFSRIIYLCGLCLNRFVRRELGIWWLKR
jgi:hypothetical protein